MKVEAISQQTPAAKSHVFGDEVHLLDLLIILSKRRRLILWFTLGTSILTAITVLILPSAYTAQTVLLPPAQNSSLSTVLQNQLGGSAALASLAGSSLGIKNPGDMYVSLFRSETVEDALIHRLDLMGRYHQKRLSDTRKALENRSTVVLGAKDGLIRITVTDRDPNVAAQIANGYVEEFQNLSDHLALTEASQRQGFFEEQLKKANDNLTAAQEALKRTEQSTGVLQIDSQAKTLIESAASLRGEITAKEVQLQALRSYATEDNPQVALTEEQLTALKSQLAKLSGTSADASSDIIVPKGNIPEAGMRYLNSFRDVRYYETIYELIAKQLEMAKLDVAREGAIIQVVDRASPPDHRSFPKRTITVILAIVISFFVACLWSVFAERFNVRRNPDDLRRLEELRATFKR